MTQNVSLILNADGHFGNFLRSKLFRSEGNIYGEL